MGRGLFGMMSPSSRILHCLLLLVAAVCGTVISLPDHLVCNLESEAVSSLSQNDALTLAKRISENCVITHRKCPKTGEERMLPFQVAVALISKFHEFSPETLTSLGQVAVGLSVTQIESRIRNEDLLASLPPLSKVRGWNAQQAGAVLRKLFRSGYQMEDGRSLAALGSLVAGLEEDRLQGLPPSMVLEALKVPGFATQLENLSPSQKRVFVDKLITATGGFEGLVKHIPEELAPYVPKSLLVPVGEFNIQDLSRQPWTQEQAAVFFDDVIRTVHNFSSLSASILHGFTCAAASNLNTERLQELAKAMKEKKVQLGKDQLLCLADRLMLRGMPQEFNDYPEDLVLFVSPSDYGAIGSCKEYFARVGRANVDLLEKGSSQRKQLLAEALDCLKISGPHVNRENAEILGRLACDLSAEYFKTSGRNLLKQLTECRSFSPDQAKAIQVLLCSGNTPVGPPSEWTSSTLEELSGLFPVFDHCILQKIPASVLMPRLKCFLHKSHLPRKDLAALGKNLRSPRHKRATACAPDRNITDQEAQDVLLPIEYPDPEELQACLGDEVLLRNLGFLSEYAFSDEQMAVFKEKLDKIYPDGYPDSVLRNLGGFLTLMGPEDVKKWKFNSNETLAALLANEPPSDLAAAIISQYIDNGGPLDAEALNAIGTDYICLLEPAQLKKISEEAIKAAEPLDPSSCNQTTKDILYPKAKRAFSDRHNPPYYYDLIKPYLGGAPGEDLRALSKDNVNMNISTFMGLRKDAVLKLTPSEVKALLGTNLPDLKNQKDNSPLKEWIPRQKQSELDRLGFGVSGGTPDGYIILPPSNKRPAQTSGATGGLALHLFPSLLLTVSLTAFLS